MLSLLRRWTNRARQGAVAARRPARTLLNLEALEDRCVPTVVFNPAFGAETVSGTNDGMQNPNVHLIFAGTYWDHKPQGGLDEAAMLTSARNILSGPYLSRLTQYGASGTATLASCWGDDNVVPRTGKDGTPTQNDLQKFLQNSIANHSAAPGIHDAQHAPIYVVISDPASSGAGQNGGWNAQGTYKGRSPRIGGGSVQVKENTNMIWIGTNTLGQSNVWRDVATSVFSHEMAEAISDPDANGITVAPPAGLPKELTGGYTSGQIGDFEPESVGQHYGYRLGGDMVQPYWSRDDSAFVVPDGNVQRVNLTPIWNGASFTGKYDLSVQGDQLGAYYNDNIQVDSLGNGQSLVFMNNETFVFDPKAIRNINIDAKGGDNTIRAAGVASGVTLYIDSTGFQRTNKVIVGSEFDSLFGLYGVVNVPNSSTKTEVAIYESSDGILNTTLNGQAINFTLNGQH
jgi:hypothetical protein